MIFKFFLMLFFFLSKSAGLRIGLYDYPPYIGQENGACNTIIQKICNNLLLDYTIIHVSDESDGINCVANGTCDATIGLYSSVLSMSYPLLTVSVI